MRARGGGGVVVELWAGKTDHREFAERPMSAHIRQTQGLSSSRQENTGPREERQGRPR